MTILRFSHFLAESWRRKARGTVNLMLAGDHSAHVDLGDVATVLREIKQYGQNGELLVDLGNGDALVLRLHPPETAE